MTPAEQAARALRSWLSSSAGDSWIRDLVAHRSAGLREGVAGNYLAHRFGPDSGQLQEDLVQEFHEFLLGSFLPRLDRMPDQVNAIINGKTGQVLRFALQKFSWELQSAARHKKNNPRGYLYRRIREVLARDSRFVLHRHGRDLISYVPANLPEPGRHEPAELSPVEYGGWPRPPEPAGRDALFTAAYLGEAALFFYSQVTDHLGRAMQVPLRELARYLAAHHPWIDCPLPGALSDQHSSATDSETMEERIAGISALDSITVLAEQFACQLDGTARRIFYWTLEDPPLSFAEIARRLDLPDHNRPYRIHQRTTTALKRFTATWPGPPLAELPEEVGLVFIEHLRKICKKSLARP